MSTSRSPRSGTAPVHPTRQQLDELDALLQRMLELPVNKVEDGPPAQAPQPKIADRGSRIEDRGSTDSEDEARAFNSPGALAAVPSSGLASPTRVPETASPLEEPEPEESSPVPVGARLAVQPPHLFRHRSQPRDDAPADEQPDKTPENQENGEDWVPLRSSWKPSPHTWPPLAESWHQARHATDNHTHLRRDDPIQPPLEDPEATIDDRGSKIEDRASLLLDPRSSILDLREPSEPRSSAKDTETSAEPAFDAEQDAQPETILYPRPTLSFQQSYAAPSTATSEPSRAAAMGPALALDNTQAMPWVWRPLVWINCAFAAIVALAGPPGRWLAGPAGRTMLGIVGILCLLGAVGLLVADWLGWTW